MKAKLIKKGKNHYDLRLDDGGLYTSTYQWTSNGNLLSLKNCQAIERGYDLDELAYRFNPVQKLDNEYIRNGFKAGFQKALEILGDKKFSEEDMRKAIEIARNGFMQEQHNGYGRPTGLRFVLDNLPSNDIIQSLQQTEWDVEVEMEDNDKIELSYGATSIKDSDYILRTQYIKLDTDGCLILKRI